MALPIGTSKGLQVPVRNTALEVGPMLASRDGNVLKAGELQQLCSRGAT